MKQVNPSLKNMTFQPGMGWKETHTCEEKNKFGSWITCTIQKIPSQNEFILA